MKRPGSHSIILSAVVALVAGMIFVSLLDAQRHSRRDAVESSFRNLSKWTQFSMLAGGLAPNAPLREIDRSAARNPDDYARTCGSVLKGPRIYEVDPPLQVGPMTVVGFTEQWDRFAGDRRFHLFPRPVRYLLYWEGPMLRSRVYRPDEFEQLAARNGLFVNKLTLFDFPELTKRLPASRLERTLPTGFPWIATLAIAMVLGGGSYLLISPTTPWKLAACLSALALMTFAAIAGAYLDPRHVTWTLIAGGPFGLLATLLLLLISKLREEHPLTRRIGAVIWVLFFLFSLT